MLNAEIKKIGLKINNINVRRNVHFQTLHSKQNTLGIHLDN